MVAFVLVMEEIRDAANLPLTAYRRSRRTRWRGIVKQAAISIE
jgi:hypothetical protein